MDRAAVAAVRPLPDRSASCSVASRRYVAGATPNNRPAAPNQPRFRGRSLDSIAYGGTWNGTDYDSPYSLDSDEYRARTGTDGLIWRA